MAIGIFNSLQFGGVDSADYGIYITGAGAFNAPSRAVEMVSVPGRNGDVAIDMGHWNNIQIEYPAGCFGSDPSEFAANIAAFRNAIAPLIGYQRLTDTYNPEEYRMALYSEGLEVDPVNMNEAGEFTLIFNAKPQRWLTSGESAVSVTSGDDLENPTSYDSSPLLEVRGYGNINFNGYKVTLANELVGDATIPPQSFQLPYTVDFSDIPCNNGDAIKVYEAVIQLRYYYPGHTITNVLLQSYNGTLSSAPSISYDGEYVFVTLTFNSPISFVKYTPGSGWFELTFEVKEGGTTIATEHTRGGFNYFVSSDTKIEFGLDNSLDLPEIASGYFSRIVISSTATVYGNPTYIDCDIGEAYATSGGNVESLNEYIALGSDLPTLASGSNIVTYSGTITSLKITPRWWQL